ncbi:hypothetical protein QA641_20505 [Bradyrhizobium sp. CB1650]|uniref:hypothetical protein n=1 Tax=Bradyrhizobium sp. CB1650 TaxID=3039153 RepID=UPI0024347DF5|nr:hypothetical protein [Bradyrhizobium sp. CB1650]WGD56064.1 hypothetical protein QA641_20505 [Bradyrhizobium sp. CB1650]
MRHTYARAPVIFQVAVTGITSICELSMCAGGCHELRESHGRRPAFFGAAHNPEFVRTMNGPPMLLVGNDLQIKRNPMKRDEVFPSKYLKCSDLNGQAKVVTIERAPFEILRAPDGKEQGKTVLYFRGAKKAFPLNRINYDAVSEIVGDDETDNWPGQIEIFPDKTLMAGKMVDCIRIRAPTQPSLRKPTATKSPPPEGLDDDIPF